MTFWDGLFIGWGIGIFLVLVYAYCNWRRSYEIDEHETMIDGGNDDG